MRSEPNGSPFNQTSVMVGKGEEVDVLEEIATNDKKLGVTGRYHKHGKLLNMAWDHGKLLFR